MNTKNMNTKISYLYRDASNYKVYNDAVVRGEAAKEQAKEIFSCLQDGEYFIPGQVGLPESRFDDITEDDHAWFELLCLENTKEAPNVDMDVSEILERFQKAKGNWNPMTLERKSCPALREAADDMEIGRGTYDIGFNDGDETEFDLMDGEGINELEELWLDFCKEEGCDPDSVDYIEEVEPEPNELMVAGWVYYKTKATTTEEALSEFYKACEKAGINADNMQKAELRDPDGDEMPDSRK